MNIVVFLSLVHELDFDLFLIHFSHEYRLWAPIF